MPELPSVLLPVQMCIRDRYNEMQASALAAAKRGYVDDIIEASETRQRVVAAFEMLFTKREDRPSKKHGTI